MYIHICIYIHIYIYVNFARWIIVSSSTRDPVAATRNNGPLAKKKYFNRMHVCMKNCMYIYIHNYNQLMYIYIYDCWCCKHLYPMTLLVNCPICREGQIQRPTLKNNNCGRPIFAAERLRRLQPYVQSTPQCLHLKSPHGRQFGNISQRTSVELEIQLIYPLVI